MKKVLSILLSTILVLSLFSGCSSKKNTENTVANNQATAASTSGTNNQSSSSTTNQSTTKQETQSTTTNTTAAANTTVQPNTASTTNTNSTTTKNTVSNASGTKNTGKTPVSTGSGAVKEAAKPAVSFDEALNGAVQYVEKAAASKEYKISDWDAVALRISGRDLSSKGYIEYKGAGIGKELDGYYMTDYARSMLGIMAGGYDPTSFQGIELSNIIKNSTTAGGKFMDTVKGGEDLVNCHVWSMIALEAAGVAYDKDSALKYLEGKQNPDGGFYIFAPYPDSDMDFTAMSVMALTMAGRDKNSQSVSKALGYLKNKLSAMEKKPELETAETLSVILQAVVSANDDVKSYKINGKNIVDEILAFRDSSGGFKHIKTDAVNDIATRQVLTALAFYKNNRNMYKELTYAKGSYYNNTSKEAVNIKLQSAFYDAKSGTAEISGTAGNFDIVVMEMYGGKDPVKEEIKPVDGRFKLTRALPSAAYNAVISGIKDGRTLFVTDIQLENVESGVKASVRIESYDKNILNSENIAAGNKRVFDYDGNYYTTGKLSVYSLVMKALVDMNIASNVSYSYGAPYINSISGIAGGKFGGWDGWMYFVNGKDPGAGMTDVEVKDGDEILLYYGDWGIRPLEISLPQEAAKGQSVQITVKSDDKPVESAAVWANGKKYITDGNGTAYIETAEQGNIAVYAEKLDEKGKPQFVRSEIKTVIVK